MYVKLFLACVLITLVTGTDDVTFKNVLVQFYSMYTYKFNVTIASSSSLKDNIPKKLFDTIKIADSDIPILHKNSISDIDSLDELILDNNGITKIQPGAFKKVDQLRKLEITNNKNLEEIKNGVFNKLKISVLNLNKNSLNSIASGAFDDMPELLTISLADNKLQVWNPNWFANTPLLSRVSMQNNSIREIPADAFKNFQGEKKLGSISLTINIILSYNNINQIDEDAFKSLTEINNLWLDNNKLETWNENLLSGIAVKDLRIDGNQIKCFGGDLAKIFVSQSTHIDDNPIDCQCLKNVESWASENKKEVVMYFSKMRCDIERIDKKMKKLQERLKELRAEDSEQVTASYI